MADSDFAIKVTNLHKSFKLPTERAWGLKQAIFNRLRGIKGYKKQRVLKDINLEIKKGEFVGIVGKNGGGKSTLLKLLAGIYQPDSGKIEVDGTLVPFIELGVGFNPELTGRDNIYMNGALLGFSNQEVDAMYKEIVDFAELEDFMDQKLKNYSSGMQVRLAFSIAIRANSDILLLDEVLAVGDEAFQRKCYAYFAKLKREKKTVILVTHSMDSVQQFCTRAILVDGGQIIHNGNPAAVAQKYRELNLDKAAATSSGASRGKTKNKYLSVRGSANVTDKKIHLNVEIKALTELNDPIVGICLYREDGTQIYRWASDEKIDSHLDLSKNAKIEIALDNILPDGEFDGSVIVRSRDRSDDYGIFDNVFHFTIDPRNSHVQDAFWKIPEEYKIY